MENLNDVLNSMDNKLRQMNRKLMEFEEFNNYYYGTILKNKHLTPSYIA